MIIAWHFSSDDRDRSLFYVKATSITPASTASPVSSPLPLPLRRRPRPLRCTLLRPRRPRCSQPPRMSRTPHPNAGSRRRPPPAERTATDPPAPRRRGTPPVRSPPAAPPRAVPPRFYSACTEAAVLDPLPPWLVVVLLEFSVESQPSRLRGRLDLAGGRTLFMRHSVQITSTGVTVSKAVTAGNERGAGPYAA